MVKRRVEVMKGRIQKVEKEVERNLALGEGRIAKTGNKAISKIQANRVSIMLKPSEAAR